MLFPFGGSESERVPNGFTKNRKHTTSMCVPIMLPISLYAYLPPFSKGRPEAGQQRTKFNLLCRRQGKKPRLAASATAAAAAGSWFFSVGDTAML